MLSNVNSTEFIAVVFSTNSAGRLKVTPYV